MTKSNKQLRQLKWLTPPNFKLGIVPNAQWKLGKLTWGMRARVSPPTPHHPCKAALQAPTVSSAPLETLASVGQWMDQHHSEG